MEPILYQWSAPLYINNGPACTFPTGIVGWSDMGVLLVWCVLLAFVGCMLALIREGLLGHYLIKARRNVRFPRRRPAHTGPAPARLAYAHSTRARHG